MTLDATQRRAILAHPAGWIASGFGSGLSPFASGTVGSAVALIPWLALRELDWPLYLGAVALAFAVGVWASGVVIARLRVAFKASANATTFGCVSLDSFSEPMRGTTCSRASSR